MEAIRPWGKFQSLASGPGWALKILTLDPDQRISLQQHSARSELWVVVEGGGTVSLGERLVAVEIGSTITIDLGQVHRAQGGPAGMMLVEVQLGERAGDESDITRLEDDYGRM